MSRQRNVAFADAATRANSSPFAASTYLAQQAALLSPGQCIKFATDITKAQTEPENEDVLQWAISAAYDSVNKQVHYIGKIAGPALFHWLKYDEATNHWTLDSPAPSWTTSSDSGHGFDHNTCDNAGNFYHVPYNSAAPRKWNGSSWSTLTAWTQNTTATGGLTWTPWGGGQGTLFYNDGIQGLLSYNFSGSWTTVFAQSNGSYHDFSEYNSTADVLIFGGGNGNNYYKYTGSGSPTQIADPSAATGLTGFRISANAGDQGIVCSDPSAAKLIAYYIETGLWAEYNITTDTWTKLTQSTGNGATPQTGLPNFTTDSGNAIICVSLPPYGCTMWIARPGAGENLNVWLYRHT